MDCAWIINFNVLILLLFYNLNSDLADTGWIYPTLESEFTDYYADSSWRIRYRRTGNKATVWGAAQPKNTIKGNSDQHTIFTLPEGFRPMAHIDKICQGSQGSIWTLRISHEGPVTFSRYRDGSSYVDTPADVWLPFHETFYIN